VSSRGIPRYTTGPDPLKADRHGAAENGGWWAVANWEGG